MKPYHEALLLVLGVFNVVLLLWVTHLTRRVEDLEWRQKP